MASIQHLQRSASHGSNEELALFCAKAAIDKKALNSIIYNIGARGAFTDFFLITSGTNERQVQAISDEIVAQAKHLGISKPRVEGYDEGRWILVDFGGVVAHVFHDYIREFYDLESLWAESPRISIPEEYYTQTAGAATTSRPLSP